MEVNEAKMHRQRAELQKLNIAIARRNARIAHHQRKREEAEQSLKAFLGVERLPKSRSLVKLDLRPISQPEEKMEGQRKGVRILLGGIVAAALSLFGVAWAASRGLL